MSLPPETFELIQKAASFCAKAHRHQERPDGTPYAAHPYRVCLTLRHLFAIDDSFTLCAALLHDVIEDSGVSYDDLHAGFGEEIADLVAGMTKDLRLPEAAREAEFAKRLRDRKTGCQVSVFSRRRCEGESATMAAGMPTSPLTSAPDAAMKSLKNRRLFISDSPVSGRGLTQFGLNDGVEMPLPLISQRPALIRRPGKVPFADNAHLPVDHHDSQIVQVSPELGCLGLIVAFPNRREQQLVLEIEMDFLMVTGEKPPFVRPRSERPRVAGERFHAVSFRIDTDADETKIGIPGKTFRESPQVSRVAPRTDRTDRKKLGDGPDLSPQIREPDRFPVLIHGFEIPPDHSTLVHQNAISRGAFRIRPVCKKEADGRD